MDLPTIFPPPLTSVPATAPPAPLFNAELATLPTAPTAVDVAFDFINPLAISPTPVIPINPPPIFITLATVSLDEFSLFVDVTVSPPIFSLNVDWLSEKLSDDVFLTSVL